MMVFFFLEEKGRKEKITFTLLATKQVFSTLSFTSFISNVLFRALQRSERCSWASCCCRCCREQSRNWCVCSKRWKMRSLARRLVAR